jgi:HEAT repeat protein
VKTTACCLLALLLAPLAAAQATPWKRTGVDDAFARALHLLDRPEVNWPARPAPANHADPRLAYRLSEQAMHAPEAQRADALAALGPAKDLPHARRLLLALHDGDATVRNTAVDRLQHSPAPHVADALRGLIGPDFALEPHWAAALAPIASPALEREMLGLLDNADAPPELRASAARCLALLRRPGAVPALARAIGENLPPLSQAALDALFFLRAAESIPQWLDLTQHPDPEVQVTAVRALADLGGPAANAALLAIAQGEDGAASRMQSAALQGIDAWPMAEALPALIQVMERNPDLRLNAARILRARTGVELGDDPALWRAWLAGDLDRPPDGDLPPEITQPPAGDPSQDALPFSVQFTP